jgi:uncharacterized membrane protein YeiH
VAKSGKCINVQNIQKMNAHVERDALGAPVLAVFFGVAGGRGRPRLFSRSATYVVMRLPCYFIALNTVMLCCLLNV